MLGKTRGMGVNTSSYQVKGKIENLQWSSAIVKFYSESSWSKICC
jgi:hypothetical protein